VLQWLEGRGIAEAEDNGQVSGKIITEGHFCVELRWVVADRLETEPP